METTIYLAMTAGEMAAAETIPEHPAWMACHFSSYSTGLSNCPTSLPPGSLLMVNDRTPIWHHDPARILLQLQHMAEALAPEGIVLDFQRPGCWETEQLVGILVKELACPVAVSELYAGGLSCPVFLSSPPLHTPLKEHLANWAGREIWLEAVLSAETLTVTPDGCSQEEAAIECVGELPFEETELFCRYGFTLTEEKAVFTLLRQQEEQEKLLEGAKGLGVERAVGLYQQLHKKPSD